MSRSRIGDHLESLGIQLPSAPRPAGNYWNALIVGDHLHLAGHGPLLEGRPPWRGSVPSQVSLEEAVEAARLTALNCLATVEATLGTLDRVEQVVRMFGMVNADTDFTDHVTVLNGASDLLVQVFGEQGRSVRAAVGMSSLPMGIPVEIEMQLAIK
ncbi:MAG TPA: RidA family protein [Nocardioides sp.]|nr:RidA family protein [Nocardioides sp.]